MDTATKTTSYVSRDRKAESMAMTTLNLAGRFGGQVAKPRLLNALQIVGWRDGADAVNRANDPACGQPTGWQSSARERGLTALELKLGRLLDQEEIAAFRGGFDEAVSQGGW